MSDSLFTLRSALAEAGYRLGETENETSFLAENPERVIWSTVFETPSELLERWVETQADAIERTHSLSAEKSWELYLLLGTELAPATEMEAELNDVHRDISYARKVLVLGLEEMSGAELDSHLSPLRDLRLDLGAAHPDAIHRLDELVAAEGNDDVAAVLRAFKENRPLFEEL